MATRWSRRATAADALRIVEAGEPAIDLVITDLVMPEMGGRELVERLRARHPGLKVLFMSGYSERAVPSDGVMPPGTGFVEKPFTVEQLTQQRDILDEAGAGTLAVGRAEYRAAPAGPRASPASSRASRRSRCSRPNGPQSAAAVRTPAARPDTMS